MRIASLVPSATEMGFALGLGDRIVAVTHECDHPASAAALPHLTRSVIPPGLSPAGIDAAVHERIVRGKPLYELDDGLLAELDVDLIVTQAVCAVCAVSYDDVTAVAARLPARPRVLSLDPSRLDDVLEDVLELARAAEAPERGQALRARLSARIEAVRNATEGRPRPRVAALEWLDPPYAGGHWVPEMISAAGGADVLARPGERSRQCTWDEVAASRPEVVIVMPCGLNCAEAEQEARARIPRLSSLGAKRLLAVDAAASFSRPGPRLVDGIELLGHALHPDTVPPPRALSFAEIAVVGTSTA